MFKNNQKKERHFPDLFHCQARNRTQSVTNILGLAEINEIDVVSQLVLQIFNHTSNVLDVGVVHRIKRIPCGERKIFKNCMPQSQFLSVLLSLSLARQRAGQLSASSLLGLGFDRKHHGRGQIVHTRLAVFLNFHHVNSIPNALGKKKKRTLLFRNTNEKSKNYLHGSTLARRISSLLEKNHCRKAGIQVPSIPFNMDNN